MWRVRIERQFGQNRLIRPQQVSSSQETLFGLPSILIPLSAIFEKMPYHAQELYELATHLGRGFVLYPVAYIVDF